MVMAFSKAHRFKASDYHFSLLCKALSHPVRIVILRKLIESTEQTLSVEQLSSGIPLVSSTISHHLKMLRDMHILRCDGMGSTVDYSINSDLPNTSWGVIQLVILSNVKYDDLYDLELPLIGSRRTTGAVPV
jgi:DNA-binding transcriptional ArsR family regulator